MPPDAAAPTGEQQERYGMQIGLIMRSGNNGGNGAINAHRWDVLREMALLAEDIGVDTLGAPDHLLFRTPRPSSIYPRVRHAAPGRSSPS